MQFVDLKRQYNAYKQEIDIAIANVINSARFVMGPEIEELETKLAEFVGTSHAIGVSSGTDALLLSLMALDIKPKDEVITTPFSFIATAEVIVFLKARPIFVDIDPVTFNIDANLIEETIKARLKQGANIKAILPVSLFGQCADMDEINRIGSAYNIKVIEDGCQSFGAVYMGAMSCGLSDIGVTSFFPSKPLGCYGDGGMVFTNDHYLYERIKRLRNHGQSVKYKHHEIGLNARLDTIQAAVLLAKFPHFLEELEKRVTVANIYTQLIENRLKDKVLPPIVPEHQTSVFAQYTIRILDNKRDQVLKSLQKNQIPYAIHYPVPLHMQPSMEALGYKKGDFPIAEQASKEVLSLPMHPFLTIEEQEKIIDAISNAY